MIPEHYRHYVDSLSKNLATDDEYLAVAVGGSWKDDRMDRFSDIDLVIVHRSESLSLPQRKAVAESAGDLLVSFTGEHVGEPRLLICLYDNPLLHVDLKFVPLPAMAVRVEDPLVIWERDRVLTDLMTTSQARFPHPDFQWIEDRFWVWLHYAAAKVGRGELFETLTFLSFVQQTVLGPLALLRNGALPKGVRQLETTLMPADLQAMQQTTAGYDRLSCLEALHGVVAYYQVLRQAVMPATLTYRTRAEERVMAYLEEIGDSFPTG
ncbi:MAG: aminoglycoside 6-adenylyltransferase [Bacteroidetes bacterium]|nr:aminoglycoside 6-adenylyltransferase [Fibrella sp.]